VREVKIAEGKVQKQLQQLSQPKTITHSKLVELQRQIEGISHVLNLIHR
jgi:hypothetical protein